MQTERDLTVYLGTHMPSWINKTEFANVPLFISHLRLRDRKTLPPAATTWALDSGGFTCVTKYGGFLDSPKQYAEKVALYQAEMGKLQFVAIQDWMNEPVALDKTGMTVSQHQSLTVRSALELTDIAPEMPWMYVLQGFREDEYLRCLDMYYKAGIDVESRVFGLGSICRRQGTKEAASIVSRLTREGVNLHLFGFKQQGLERVSRLSNVMSSDSLAWSKGGRSAGPCKVTGNKNCANCIHYALDWYLDTLLMIANAQPSPWQLGLSERV